MEVEVAGLTTRQLMDGRLSSVKTVIAAQTSGMLKAANILFVRAENVARRQGAIRIAFVMLFESAAVKVNQISAHIVFIEAGNLVCVQGSVSFVCSRHVAT